MITGKAEIILGKGVVGMTPYGDDKESGIVFHNIEPVEIGEYLDKYPTDKEIKVSIMSSSPESIQVLIDQLEIAKSCLIEKINKKTNCETSK